MMFVAQGAAYPIAQWVEMCAWLIDHYPQVTLYMRWDYDSKMGHDQELDLAVLHRWHAAGDITTVRLSAKIVLRGPEELLIWFRMKFL